MDRLLSIASAGFVALFLHVQIVGSSLLENRSYRNDNYDLWCSQIGAPFDACSQSLEAIYQRNPDAFSVAVTSTVFLYFGGVRTNPKSHWYEFPNELIPAVMWILETISLQQWDNPTYSLYVDNVGFFYKPSIAAFQRALGYADGAWWKSILKESRVLSSFHLTGIMEQLVANPRHQETFPVFFQIANNNPKRSFIEQSVMAILEWEAKKAAKGSNVPRDVLGQIFYGISSLQKKCQGEWDLGVVCDFLAHDEVVQAPPEAVQFFFGCGSKLALELRTAGMDWHPKSPAFAKEVAKCRDQECMQYTVDGMFAAMRMRMPLDTLVQVLGGDPRPDPVSLSHRVYALSFLIGVHVQAGFKIQVAGSGHNAGLFRRTLELQKALPDGQQDSVHAQIVALFKTGWPAHDMERAANAARSAPEINLNPQT